jgi:hypothetical protein
MFQLSDFERVFEHDFDACQMPYDYESIMHYGRYDLAIDPNVPTIIALDERYTNTIGQATGLSALDVKRVRLLYKCDRELDSNIESQITANSIAVINSKYPYIEVEINKQRNE